MTAAASGEKACAFCGNSMTAGAIVCMNCGRDLTGRQRRPGAESPAAAVKPRDRSRTLMIAALAVGAGVALGMTMARLKLEPQKAAPVLVPAKPAAAPAPVSEEVQQQRRAEDEARRARYEQETKELSRQVERDMNRKRMRDMDQVVQRWTDAFRVANSTPKIALAGPVSQLQAIRRDAVNTEVPDCLLMGKLALMESMNETLEAFIVFMRSSDGSGKAAVEARFNEAGKRLQQFAAARNRCLQ